MRALYDWFMSDRYQLGLAIAFLVLMLLGDAIQSFNQGKIVFGIIDILLAYWFGRDYWTRWRHKIK